MQQLRTACLGALMLCSCASPSSVAVHAGQRDYAIADDLLNGLAQPFSLGADLVLGVLPWQVGLEGSLLRARDTASSDSNPIATERELETLEAALGLRRGIQLGDDVELFVGAGWTHMNAELTLESPGMGSQTDSARANGGYLKVGMSWPLGPLRAGLEARRTFGAEAALGGSRVDLDYELYTLSIGFRF